jgi:hypothetical protein
MVSMLFSPKLAVTAFDNNSRDGRYPLNPPRVEREGHLWASFEHQLERPLTRRAVYGLGTFIAQFPAAEVGRWPVYVSASLDGFSPVAATLYVDLQKPE